MTIVAWDGRFLAVDTQANSHDARCVGAFDKLVVVDGLVYAFVGYMGMLLPWIEAGGSHPPIGADENCTLIGWHPEQGLRSWSGAWPHASPAASIDVWGSGSRIALGALHLGATAMEAAALAIGADLQCGGCVRFCDTQAAVLWVQEWNPAQFLALAPSARRWRRWWSVENKPESDVVADRISQISSVDTEPAGGEFIVKPKKPEGGWKPECQGRLLYGTGCGECLRCNREWYYWQNRAVSDELVASAVGAPMIRITPRLRAMWSSDPANAGDRPPEWDLIATRTEAERDADIAIAVPPPGRERHIRDTAVAMFGAELVDWCEEFNRLSSNGSTMGGRIGVHMAKLRAMTIPPGVEIVDVPPDADYTYWRKALRKPGAYGA